jgi:prepilin-type N-terminal cleavage/methylation domain-containing protein
MAERGRTGGFTLVEVMIAVALVTAVFAGVLGALIMGLKEADFSRDLSLGIDAARRKAEELASGPFRLVFFRYNETASDDPTDPLYPARGPGVLVEGLAPRPGDPDGFVGRVILPSQTSNATRLIETLDTGGDAVKRAALARLGMPRDLDGDGAVGAANVAKTYILLPVTIRLEWRGVYGDGEYSLDFILADRSGT